jgi:DNA gyrase subunit A
VTQDSLLDGDAGGVREVDIAERMERSFLDYSMSVIVGRALPDVRDGLKPVQRRILYAMWEAGLRPERPYRKCASAVGDVMKKYHPHGDASIYEALVRMAQDFASRERLVDGHGNFGSLDGDGAAAMRYTEARLSPMAMEALDGIDEATVELSENYDGYELEPAVLPCRFPNLLVNGASGIAVGMATAIPPHNLTETIDACLTLIDNPQAGLDQLMTCVPGPDFPTGARVVDDGGIAEAYRTGRGRIDVESVATTETRTGGLPRIVVTEIPYQINKATMLERMADLVRDKRLEAIRDLRDESSSDGLRIVIELKRGEDPAQVLARLYELTELRTSFNVNFVALSGGQPVTLGLTEALGQYLAHQRDVLTRRTTYRRDRAAERAHIVAGLLTALDHLDEVIALIRGSETVDDAREALMSRYELSEAQARAILDMQLRRLAALERQKLADEYDELVARIAELEAILADPAKLDGLLRDELTALRDRYERPRRSRITGPETQPNAGEAASSTSSTAASEAKAAAVAQLEAQPVTVYVTAGGYLKSVARRRTSKPHSHPKDPLVAVVRATTEDTLLVVDTAGRGYRAQLADLEVTTMRKRGSTVAQVTNERLEAPVTGAVTLGPATTSTGAASTLLTASARGLVKRTAVEEFASRARGLTAASVKGDDELIAAAVCADEDELLLAHDGGQVIRFPAAEARVMGRNAAGVSGLTVPNKARLVAASVVPAGLLGSEDGDSAGEKPEVVTVQADGRAKRAPLAEYTRQGRGGKGLRAGAEPLAWCGPATDLHIPTADGYTVLDPGGLTQRHRTGAPAAATPAVTGPVVGESPTP